MGLATSHNAAWEGRLFGHGVAPDPLSCTTSDASATIGGTANDQTPICMWSNAAAPHPSAKTATITDIRARRDRDAAVSWADEPWIRSARSSMICVVVPVISVDGGRL